MRPRGFAAGLLAASAALALALAGCSAALAESARPHEPPVLLCQIDADLPWRWQLSESLEVPAWNTVGIREIYRADRGRLLHFTSGIDGEFGTALPQRAAVRVVGGEEARLLGLRSGRIWVLVWNVSDGCRTRSVTGVGLARAMFVGVLRRAGVIVGRP